MAMSSQHAAQAAIYNAQAKAQAAAQQAAQQALAAAQAQAAAQQQATAHFAQQHSVQLQQPATTAQAAHQAAATAAAAAAAAAEVASQHATSAAPSPLAASAQVSLDAQAALDAHTAASLAELQAQAQAHAQAAVHAQAQAQVQAAAKLAQDHAMAIAEAQQRAAAQAQALAQAEQARMQQAQQQAQREQAIQEAKKRREDQAKKATQEKEAEEKLRCHLHKKPNKVCKFCKRYQEHVASRDERKAQEAKETSNKNSFQAAGRHGALEIVNTKTYGFSPLLQTHIVESAHFKALLALESFDQILEEMQQFANSIEPYMANSNTTPSALFACLYRLFTMGCDSRQLRKLMDYLDNAYVRCLGFLFVRFGLPPDQLWNWLGEYVLDDEELRPAKDSEWRTTIGEFVEGLLSQDKYYSTVLPRLPMSTKRQLEAKLAPIPQSRKRAKCNLAFLDVYREAGVRVEVNLDGEWFSATTLEMIEDIPSRLKITVRTDNDDSEKSISLGRIIIADSRYRNTVGRMPRGRSRSRSRDGVDWAREKGKSDKDLVEEMRKNDREKFVCSSGKEYAKKPLGYKAACALPREQGAASHRLMEEETFVPMKQVRRRSPSPVRQEQDFRKAPSAEHQARMQQLFEKYGMQKAGPGAPSSSGSASADQTDVLRFG